MEEDQEDGFRASETAGHPFFTRATDWRPGGILFQKEWSLHMMEDSFGCALQYVATVSLGFVCPSHFGQWKVSPFPLFRRSVLGMVPENVVLHLSKIMSG